MSFAYRSTQVKLNYPNKVMSVNVTSSLGLEYWPFANGEDDRWYSGGSTPRYYRWRVTFEVTKQEHGSHLTRDDFEYNGLDVVVGDWIANSAGKCLKVISISAKTKTSVTCVVEDWLRYNTFNNSIGDGSLGTGPSVIFTLNELGLPVLDPFPAGVTSTFFATVMSRFQYLNSQANFVLEQPGHSFVKGDVISITNDGFVKANSLTADRMVGVITESGLGPNMFLLAPNNRIVDFDPKIPGQAGDFIYVSSTGDLTNSPSGTDKVVFLNIRESIPTVLNGTQSSPSVLNGHTISINGISITFNGSGGSADAAEMADQINLETANHHVIASEVSGDTIAVSSSVGTAYGLVGGYTPFSAYFDTGSGSTLINFTTNAAGLSTYGVPVAIPEDMAADINAAGIPNFSASYTTSVLTITEVNGNAITITNNTPDANGRNFVGLSNVSGLPAFTAASTDSKLRLTRADGGEILIYESSEIFQNATGIFSGHTGSYPLAMSVEQGLRTGGITLVADINSRDSLSSLAGDMAYVINTGNGEWGLFIYTGDGWVEVSNQDSATTDAKTLTTTFTLPLSGNSTIQELGNVSPGRKITTISVEVLEALSGGTTAPNIVVGSASDPSQFLTEEATDLTDPVTFFNFPEYVYPNTNTDELVITTQLDHYGATTGNVVVKVTYV